MENIFTLNLCMVAEGGFAATTVVYKTYPFNNEADALKALSQLKEKMGEDRKNDPDHLRHEIVYDCGIVVVLPKRIFSAEVANEEKTAEAAKRVNAFRSLANKEMKA